MIADAMIAETTSSKTKTTKKLKKDRVTLCHFIVSALLITILFALYPEFVFAEGKVLQKAGVEDICRKKINTFYQLPENSIDVVFIGSSSAERYWAPPVAWREAGLTSYNFSTGSQPAVFAKYIMTEIQKYQTPKVFVIDVRRIIGTPKSIRPIDSRRVVTNLRPSLNTSFAKLAVTSYINQGKEKKNDLEVLNYLYNKEDQFKEKKAFRPDYFGFYEFENLFKSKPCLKTKITTQKEKLPKSTERILEGLLDYCDILDAKVLFVASPFAIETKQQKRINHVMDVIQKRGYKTINFNTEEMYKKLDLDFNRDFYNPRHVNARGTLKYTTYLNAYLAREYSLEDHRGDKAYAKYAKSTNRFFNRLQKNEPEWYKEYIRRNDAK